MSNQTDEMELTEQAQASNPHAESESSPVPPASSVDWNRQMQARLLPSWNTRDSG